MAAPVSTTQPVGPGVQTTTPQAPANPWDPAKFQSMVGRAPTQAETDFYSPLTTWATDVQNAVGGGKPTDPGQYGQGYQTPAGQTDYGTNYGRDNGMMHTMSTPGAAPAGAWTPGQTGDIKDPAYAAKLIAYYAAQPGADPSLGSDPNYWIQKMTSGAFGADQNYAIQKMQNGWKESPGGGGGSSGGFAGGLANLSPFTPAPYTPPAYAPTGTVGTPGQTQGFSNQLLEALRGRSQQSLNVNPDDPMIKGQVDAFAARQQQDLRQSLAADAERVGSNANIGAEARSGAEHAGQATSQFQAGLMGHEVDARRQEIQAALSGQQGILTAQQQMQLQEELSQLDRAQQQAQFTAGNAQQESQFGRTLANNAYQFDISDQYRNSPLAG